MSFSRSPVLRIARIAAFMLGVVVAACDVEPGGRFGGPRLEVPDCEGPGRARVFEPFEMQLRHLAVLAESTGAIVRLTGSDASPLWVDQLVFAIPEVALTRSAIAADGHATLTLDAGAIGAPEAPRLNLVLMNRCRQRSAALVGRGTITIDTWAENDGQRMRGRFEVDIVEPRTGQVLGTGLTGDFDLPIDHGSPQRAFSPTEF
jgi:hypothetical protein